MRDPPKKWMVLIALVSTVLFFITLCMVIWGIEAARSITLPITLLCSIVAGVSGAFLLSDRDATDLADTITRDPPPEEPFKFWLHWPAGQDQVRVLLATETEVAAILTVRPVIGPYDSYAAADNDTLSLDAYRDLRPYKDTP